MREIISDYNRALLGFTEEKPDQYSWNYIHIEWFHTSRFRRDEVWNTSDLARTVTSCYVNLLKLTNYWLYIGFLTSLNLSVTLTILIAMQYCRKRGFEKIFAIELNLGVLQNLP